MCCFLTCKDNQYTHFCCASIFCNFLKLVNILFLQTKQKLEEQDFKEVVSKLLCKSFLICIGMMFFYQFAGYALVVSFAGKILKQDEEILVNNETNLRYV